MKSKTLEGLMTAPPMPADRFWQVIEHARFAQDRDAHVKALRTALRKLSLEELISFEVAFRRYLNTAYTWDLWGAAYVINGGCSDDGFGSYRGGATPTRLRWPIQTPLLNWMLRPMCGASGSSKKSITSHKTFSKRRAVTVTCGTIPS